MLRPSSPIVAVAAALSAVSLLAFTSAQIVIEQFTMTPTDFFDAIFGTIGGITIADVQLTGDPSAFGIFSSGTDVIGIESGVLLSSGAAVDGNGPNVNSDTTTNFGLPGDPDLNSISASGVSNDAALFTVDFVASEPVIFSIKFVFASEEYNEFLNFEDPFGFFVDDVNVALAADNSAITVSTINCGPSGVDLNGPNCAQFNNNENNAFDIEYDGFTDVIIATSVVLDVGPHTIKLAIADEADNILDTAVFIDQNAVIVPVDEFNATVKSDPHISGFRGQQFDFEGEAGSTYAFLSCPGLQMNAHLEDAYTPGLSIQNNYQEAFAGAFGDDLIYLPFQKKGTWVTEIGFLFRDTQDNTIHSLAISAEPTEASRPEQVKFGSITLNGNLEITTVGDYYIAQGISLSITNSKSFTRINLAYEAQSFKATVDVVSPPADHAVLKTLGENIGFDVNKLWHINVQIKSLDSQVPAHGVIGQTGKTLKNGIQGEEKDYIIIDGLLGHEFAFDKFDTGFSSRRGLKQAPSTTKTNAEIVAITPAEYEALQSLDASMENLMQMSTADFNGIFYSETMATQAALNATILAQAVDRVKAGQSTPFEEAQSIKLVVSHEQSVNNDAEPVYADSLKNRNCMLRVSAVLDINKVDQ